MSCAPPQEVSAVQLSELCWRVLLRRGPRRGDGIAGHLTAARGRGRALLGKVGERTEGLGWDGGGKGSAVIGSGVDPVLERGGLLRRAAARGQIVSSLSRR